MYRLIAVQTLLGLSRTVQQLPCNPTIADTYDRLAQPLRALLLSLVRRASAVPTAPVLATRRRDAKSVLSVLVVRSCACTARMSVLVVQSCACTVHRACVPDVRSLHTYS